MEKVLVIREKDLKDYEEIVIGVADSVANAHTLMKKYYGSWTEISYTDVRDSNVEYVKILEVESYNKEPYRVEIWLEWFEINNI